MKANPLVKGFKAAVRPPDRRPPWQWCEEHLIVDNTSPMPGRWRSDSSPWVKELMECFADNRIKDIAVMCSAQSSKTQTILNCASWAIAEEPGPAMWVTANIDQAKEDIRDRISPTFNNCKPVAEKMISEGKLDFEFAGMPFYFRGAGSPAKLQSKPIRWLFLDEVRNYPPGALEMVLKRTRAFWNSRRVIISTPGKQNDAVHRAFLAGDQRRFHFCCPRCAASQELKFEQLKWDTNEATKPLGQWNFDALADTIRYACADCGHEIHDTPAERKYIARTGRFVKMNPNAPKNRVSFHWNALLPPWVTWRSIVEEFLAARDTARRRETNDYTKPLETFINETLGEPWSEELGVIEDFGFLEFRKQDYDFDEPWAEERVRFMSADKQTKGGEHYYWVVRSFGLNGRSRLVAYGRCNTKAELEAIRIQYKVTQNNAIIDSGYKANEVYRFCAATGWKPFKGDDAEYYLIKEGEKTVRRCWMWNWASPEGERVVGRPIRVRLFRHCNPWVKDLLGEFMYGLIGDWSLPKKVGRDFLRSMGADMREEHQDSRGYVSVRWRCALPHENHYKDCEEMILVAAIITKMIHAGRSIKLPRTAASNN